MQMHPENSGHNGMWTPEETTSFNNKFYKVTLELEYFSTSSVTVSLNELSTSTNSSSDESSLYEATSFACLHGLRAASLNYCFKQHP